MADLDLLALDDDDSEEESAPREKRQEKLTPFGTLPGVLFRPQATFQRMRDAERGHWWVVAVLAVIALLIFSAVQVPIQSQLVQSQIATQTAGGGPGGPGGQDAQAGPGAQAVGPGGATGILAIVGIVGGLVALFLGYLLHAGLLFLLGLVMGGRASFRQVFRMAVWTTLPAVLRNFAGAIAVIIRQELPAPGLSYLLTNTEVRDLPAFVTAILQTLDIYRIWTLILIGVGIGATYRLSRGKSTAVALIYWILTLGLIAGVAALGQVITQSFAPGG
jgi:hypothetical protein